MAEVQTLLKLLFSTFPPPPGDNFAAQLEAYAIALDGHAIQDIEAAVHKLIRGEVPGHNQSFAPSAAMVGAAVRQCLNDRLDREHRRKLAALPPPDIERTPESQARVAAKMQEAVANLASAMLTEDAAAAKRKREFQARVHARFDPQSAREMAARLGYSVGNSDVDGDMGGRAA